MTVHRLLFWILIVFLGSSAAAQTLVFTVRAPAPGCTIITQESYLWLETDNPVQVKVRGPKNMKVNVLVTGGKVVSVKDDIYYMRFTKPGAAVISVYHNTKYGRELLETKTMQVKTPELYFCSIKLDSVSKSIRLKDPDIRAYSRYYKKEMAITSFEMYYIEDTTKRKALPVRMKSDSCTLTTEMRKTILKFQPKFSSIYMLNIICKVPDGTKRILDPIQLNIEVDTANKQNLSLLYSVRRKVL